MTTIQEIVDEAVDAAAKAIATGSLDLRAIIYMAVQSGMAEAHARGIEMGKRIGEKA